MAKSLCFCFCRTGAKHFLVLIRYTRAYIRSTKGLLPTGFHSVRSLQVRHIEDETIMAMPWNGKASKL